MERSKIVHLGMSTKEENEILNILSEECAEVVQAISKVFRFGWDSCHPNTPLQTNRMHLEEELGDLLCLVDLLIDKEIVSRNELVIATQNKLAKLKKFSDIVL